MAKRLKAIARRTATDEYAAVLADVVELLDQARRASARAWLYHGRWYRRRDAFPGAATPAPRDDPPPRGAGPLAGYGWRK